MWFLKLKTDTNSIYNWGAYIAPQLYISSCSTQNFEGEKDLNNRSKNDGLLKMQGITKNFPGVTALDNVDIELKKGEILGLVGA